MKRLLARLAASLIPVLERRRGRVVACALAVMVALAAAAFPVRVDGRVETFLPATDRHLGSYVDVLRRFGAAESVYVDVTASEPSVLHAAADVVESRMRASGLIREIVGRPQDGDALRTGVVAVSAAPALLTEASLRRLEERLAPDALADRMEEHYERLMSPVGATWEPVFRSDPLDVAGLVLDQTGAARVPAGARIERRRLVSADGRHALVVGLAKAPVGDDASSIAISELVQDCSAALPPGASLVWVGGHRFHLANSAAIQSDVRLVSAAGAFLVLALIAYGFRSFRMMTLAALAMAVGGVFALAVSAACFGSVSGIALAAGAALSGVTVDYVIHLHAVPRLGERRADAIRRVYVDLLPTVTIGAATSAGAYLVLLASTVPGHRQIAVVSAASVVGAYLFAATVGPILAGWGRSDAPTVAAPRATPFDRIADACVGTVLSRPGLVCALGGALALAGIAGLPAVHFERDLRRFESKDAATLAAEDTFRAAWGDILSRSVVLVTARDREAALGETERVAAALAPFVGTEIASVTSAADLIPSPDEQRRRSQRWREFWSPARIAETREHLAAAASPLGFRADAFEPFLASLARPPEPVGPATFDGTALAPALRRHLDESGGAPESLLVISGAKAPEDPGVRWADAVHRASPTARVLTRRGLADAVADSARWQLTVLALPGLGIVFGLLLAYYRSMARASIAMLPLLAALAATATLQAALGVPLSLMNIPVALPIAGLGIDYAVFLLDAIDDAGEGPGARAEIALRSAPILGDAVTTLAGGAAMMFARHPAVWSMGLALVAGIGFSLLFTWACVPWLAARVRSRA